jgi:hypothetical protein
VIIYGKNERTLGEKRVRGYVFRTYVGDHPPLHVHVFRKGRQLGRWDIEHQRPLDDLVVNRRLLRALREAEYLTDRED